MNQEEFNKANATFINQMHEIDAQIRKNGTQFQETSIDDVKKLKESGKISNDLWEWYVVWHNEQSRKYEEWKKFTANNPNVPDKERILRFDSLPKALSLEETLKFYEETINHAKIGLLLAANKLPPQHDAQVPQKFFKSIDDDEFAMSRLVADPLNHLHKLISEDIKPELISDNSYIVQNECSSSHEGTVRLEYRFRAKTDAEALALTKEYMQRLKGRQQKVYAACWATVNKKRSRIVTCELTDLMMEAYPERKSKHSFSIKQKIEFFQDLYDLSFTQLILTKKKPFKNHRKSNISSFVIPLITIHKFSDYNATSSKLSERYPNSITFAVLHNPVYESEKMYNVGAGLKYKTLELRPEDQQLARYLQVRKSQLMDEKFIIFTDRESLMALAGLDGIAHVGMANKRLLEKFGRYQDKCIIVSYPNRVIFPFAVRIR